jgi:methylthioxylose transferase
VIVAAAVAIGAYARHHHILLGADSAPLFLTPYIHTPHRYWWPLAPLGLSLAAAWLLLRADTRLSRPVFAAAAFVIALISRAGLDTAQYGLSEWWWPFTRPVEQRIDYHVAFPLVQRDPIGFLRHYAQLVATLPIHPAGHPPGATLLSFALTRAGGGIPGEAVLILLLGAAAVWPVHVLATRLVGEGPARRAVLIFALAPSTLIYSATSLDAVFTLIAACCVAAFATRRYLIGAAAAAAGVFCAYALALAPVWAALTAPRRHRARVVVVSAAACLVVFGGVALATGYQPVAAFQATVDRAAQVNRGWRPYWYWLVGGPAAFLIMLGPMLAERFLAGVERATPGARALAACFLVATLAGVMRAEVERLWQFAVPLAAIAAAPLTTRRQAVIIIALGLVQAYVIELFWDTSF